LDLVGKKGSIFLSVEAIVDADEDAEDMRFDVRM
jgi:hypothetical protein